MTSMSVELTIPAEGEQSVLHMFVDQLVCAREERGLNRQDFAAKAFVSLSTVHKVEACQRVPSLDFVQACDRFFGTNRFERMLPTVIRYAYPPWFRPYVELEQEATRIRSFAVQLVPGLLQTEDYARVVFANERMPRHKVDNNVELRLERQRVLDRDRPPKLWVILDELVLRRRVGTPGVMCDQLRRLLDLGDRYNVVVQVIPISAGTHPGSAGAFSILRLDGDDRSLVYADAFHQGQILTDKAAVEAADDAYDFLMTRGLADVPSADLIHQALKDYAA